MLNRLNWIVVVSISLMVGFCGCKTASTSMATTRPLAVELVDRVASTHRQPLSQQHKEPTLTFSARQCRVSSFLEVVARQCGVSVVVSSQLDQMAVDVEFQAVPVSEALQTVARRLGGEAVKVGSVWYLGELRQEDRGLLVARCSRLGGVDLQLFLGVMVSEIGRVSATSDGLVVISDRAEVIDRIRKALDDLEAAPAESWVVQLYVISVSDERAHTFGLDVVPTAALSASSLAGSAASGFNWSSLFGVSGALAWDNKTTGVQLMAEPCFVLLDGQAGNYYRGLKTPIAQKVVSPEGTVSVSGYAFTETGFSINVTCRDVGESRARVDLAVVDSSITDMIDKTAPVIAEERLSGSSFVESGKLSLLLSVRRDRVQKSVSGALSSRGDDSSVKQRVMVWVMPYRTK